LFYIFADFGLIATAFQFEVHKCCNGDNPEEYDKYFNSNWRNLCIQKNAKQESLGCPFPNGKQSFCFLMMESLELSKSIPVPLRTILFFYLILI
jgi:hypothetical protein